MPKTKYLKTKNSKVNNKKTYKLKKRSMKRKSMNKRSMKKRSMKKRSMKKRLMKRKSKKQYGGDYSVEQNNMLKSRFQQFGFNDNEINTFLNKLNKSSQFYGNQFQSILDQIDAFNIRRYANGNNERNNAIRVWVEEMYNMSSDVETDVDDSQFSQDSQFSELSQPSQFSQGSQLFQLSQPSQEEF